MYRVVWLRAHARKCRWEEEVLIVDLEMDRTLAWHMRLVDTWENRRESGVSGGRKACAARQRALWQGLHDHASGVFAAARASKGMPELTIDSYIH